MQVRLILVQFIVRNTADIPKTVFGMRREKKSGERPAGTPQVQDVTNCSLQQLNLAEAGYQLVDAYTTRSTGQNVHYTVSFQFCLSEFVQLSDQFKLVQSKLTDEFGQICQSAFWKARLFTNPFFNNHVLVPNQLFVAINLNERTAIKNKDGSPVLRWQKDETGEKIGTGPVPIQPDYYFEIHDGEIKISPSEE